MSKPALACLALAACSFHGRGQALLDDAPPITPDAARDAAVDGAIDAALDATDVSPDAAVDALAPAFCDATDPTLVGCWQFEGVLTDASQYANHGTGTSIAFVPGKRGMAAQLADASHIAVADSASLTPAMLTMEAWIAPALAPTSRMGIIDNEFQYGFFLQPTGLQCVNVSVTATIAPGTWTHVACTYSGSVGTLYIDGSAVATASGGGPLGAGTADGMAIAGNSPSGDPLVGAIDEVRVWSIVRTPDQICAAAGRVSCP